MLNTFRIFVVLNNFFLRSESPILPKANPAIKMAMKCINLLFISKVLCRRFTVKN